VQALRDAVLAAVADNPDAKMGTIIALLPKIFRRQDIVTCLHDLCDLELIVVRTSRYRIAEQETPAPGPELPGTRYVSSGFIAPVPKARLMAGR
jgi:hypothetical protein